MKHMLLGHWGTTPGQNFIYVEGHEPALMHEAMAAALDTAVKQIKNVQEKARAHGDLTRPCWPMIVFNSPKGWTGPKIVDGLQVEGTFRSHQVPLHPNANPEHLKQLQSWRSFSLSGLIPGFQLIPNSLPIELGCYPLPSRNGWMRRKSRTSAAMAMIGGMLS